jgi:hypothetical protein
VVNVDYSQSDLGLPFLGDADLQGCKWASSTQKPPSSRAPETNAAAAAAATRPHERVAAWVALSAARAGCRPHGLVPRGSSGS